MKRIAVIGLSYFGKNVVDELIELDAEIIVIDKDPAVLDEYKDAPVDAVSLDVLNEESLRRVLPPGTDAVVIDLGEKIEASILATSYCRKMGIPKVVVKAETEGHAEILGLVGATKIVFPNREAAKKVVPQLFSSALLNYLPVSGSLVIAEVEVPPRLYGLSLLQANLRKDFGLNLISVRNAEEEYGLFTPEYRFREGDVALLSGTDESLEAFAGTAAKDLSRKRGDGGRTLGSLFHIAKK